MSRLNPGPRTRKQINEHRKKQAKKHQRWTGEQRKHDARFLAPDVPPSPEIPNPGDETEYESEAKA